MTRVFFRPRAIAGFARATGTERIKFNAAVDVLKRGRLPPHTKKLGGMMNGYRIRVGRWRVVLVLKNGDIDIADIFMKKGRGNYQRR